MANMLKRRRLLVDRRFQLGHAALVVAGQVLAMLATAFAVAWFYLFMQDGRLLAPHNEALFWHLAVFILLVMLAALLTSLVFTSRIVAPARKLERVLGGAAAGRLPEDRVRFRRRDLFKASEADLNALLNELRSGLGRRAALERLAEALEQGRLAPEQAACELKQILGGD
jgi:hypothetical protein